jgi:ATP-dependent exoDNAse (exonuclease V) alpha subunit
MSILNNLKGLTPSSDQLKAIQQLELFLSNDNHIFILQGYAGTGKTTLIKVLVEYLKTEKKLFQVMAPTGRASKILRDKTGHGSTIHKSIYNFEELKTINKDSEDEADHSLHYIFPINTYDFNDQQIIIVDESSMISNVESKNELFTFGTNFLLNDLLTYSSPKLSKNKIIFIGDPAQLPPVNDNNSLALKKDFFESLGYDVQESYLREIKRQSDNLILKNATTIRDLIETENRTTLKFDFDNSSFIKLDSFDVVEKYTNLYPKPEIGDGGLISFSNQQCFQYNQAIRSKLFPNQINVVPGDLLLLNNNNYHTYGVELFNGDILKVIDVDSSTIIQSAPVWCEENGKKVRKEIKLTYRKIKIRNDNHPEDIECLIIDSHLNSINKDLSFNEMRSVYINFVIRFNAIQKKREEQNLPIYKVGSKEFKDCLKVDPFYNALRVKYGYAITCHKAQGSEFEKVIVYDESFCWTGIEKFQWKYTALTRSSDKVIIGI